MSNYGFSFEYQELPKLRQLRFLEFNNVYPSVVSLEITDVCNIRCKHCYGNFGENKKNEIPHHKLRQLFKSLVDVVVVTVEFTGGDPSIYPYISEAIEIAFENGIQSVCLLTNGIYFNSLLQDTIIKYKDRIFVQIDLHSLNENYFDWFTNSSGHLPRVKSNISSLTKYGVQVRVSSIITPINYREIEEIADWSFRNGAKLYATSPVIRIGRAKEEDVQSDLVFSDPSQLEEYISTHNSIINRYPGFIRVSKGEEDRKVNSHCGALISQCCISSTGDIKICTMDTGEYFDLVIGNLLEEPLQEIFSRNTEFLTEFSRISMPKYDSIHCKDCENALFCDSYFLSGFLSAKGIVGDYL